MNNGLVDPASGRVLRGAASVSAGLRAVGTLVNDGTGQCNACFLKKILFLRLKWGINVFAETDSRLMMLLVLYS